MTLGPNSDLAAVGTFPVGRFYAMCNGVGSDVTTALDCGTRSISTFYFSCFNKRENCATVVPTVTKTPCLEFTMISAGALEMTWVADGSTQID